MADATAYLGSIVGGAQTVGMGLVGMIATIALVIIFGGVAAVGTWIYISRKKFNNKITIMEKINNSWQITKRDTAAEIRYGQDGTTVFYLKKFKKTIPKPVIQIGPRTFLFKIREDGEWINVPLIAGADEEEETLQKYMMHNDMRLARSSLQKRMTDRYEKKPSWLAQNWTWIAGISFVMVLGISVFLLFDKWIELAQVTNAGVDASGRVMEKADIVIERLADICGDGRGYVQVGGG